MADLLNSKVRSAPCSSISWILRYCRIIGETTPEQTPSTISYWPRAMVRHKLLTSTREARKIMLPRTNRIWSVVIMKMIRLRAMLASPAKKVNKIFRRSTNENCRTYGRNSRKAHWSCFLRNQHKRQKLCRKAYARRQYKQDKFEKLYKETNF